MLICSNDDSGGPSLAKSPKAGLYPTVAGPRSKLRLSRRLSRSRGQPRADWRTVMGSITRGLHVEVIGLEDLERSGIDCSAASSDAHGLTPRGELEDVSDCTAVPCGDECQRLEAMVCDAGPAPCSRPGFSLSAARSTASLVRAAGARTRSRWASRPSAMAMSSSAS